jgi:hypothetical protein
VIFKRLFQRQGAFFLDLEEAERSDRPDGGTGSAAPPERAERPEPTEPTERAERTEAPEARPTAEAAKPPAPAASPASPVLTTAEAIAEELRRAQAERPAPAVATFAPECLQPAAALPRRRRTAGATMRGFRTMAKEIRKDS